MPPPPCSAVPRVVFVCHALSSAPAPQGHLPRHTDWRVSENLVHFSAYMRTVQYWQRIALCLDHLLKSRRNRKARKLVPVAASKNFSSSWGLIGESLSVIKIDC